MTRHQPPMNIVRSQDGTPIAFDQIGQGPPLILVGGAFSYRSFAKMVQLAELLSEQYTVINYDRRGRGDSGDAKPYAVEREIEDLEAVIEAVGGSASLWGWSSGGVLALRAVAAGLPIDKLAIYEPPFVVNDAGHIPPADLTAQLHEVTASGRRGAAVRLFMTKAMGIPPIIVTLMRCSPFWSKLKATALTTPYDWAVMGDTMWGKPLSRTQWAAVTLPTLVMAGEKTPAQLRDAARALADVLPNAEHRQLQRPSHNVSMPALAPVLLAFLAGAERAAPVHAL